MRNIHFPHGRGRRGVYAAVTAVTVAMLLGFAAVAIDSGWHRMAMTQLHNAADAGAHAGALVLDGTEVGVLAARKRAQEIAQLNRVHGTQVRVDPYADIIIGRYDAFRENGCTDRENCWNPIGVRPLNYDFRWSEAVNGRTANAVLVDARSDVPTLFGSWVFGTANLKANNYAIARRPVVEQGGVPCAFPLSVPQCSMEQWTGEFPCGKVIRMRTSNANQDNMAWSTPRNNRGARVVREAAMILDDDCTNNYEDDAIDDGRSDTRLINGTIAGTYDIIQAQLAGENDYSYGNVGPYDYGDIIPTGWDPLWGQCPTGRVKDFCDNRRQDGACPDALPDCSATTTRRMIKRSATVFDDGRFECDSRGNVDGSFNRNVDVTGYVNLIIYNAYEKSGRRGDKYLDAYISCTDEEGRMRDEDEDGKPDVIHRGETVLEIEDVEKQTLAIVE